MSKRSILTEEEGNLSVILREKPLEENAKASG